MRRLLFVLPEGPVRQTLIDHLTAAPLAAAPRTAAPLATASPATVNAVAGDDIVSGVAVITAGLAAEASLVVLDEAHGGVEVCRVLRGAGATTLILLLVAEDQGTVIAAALEAGADEVLTKPFRLSRLVTTLRSLLQQAEAVSDVPDFALGPWRLSNGGRVLIDDSRDRRVRLTEKEAAILAYLQAADGVVDRDTLLDEVWGYSAAVTTHTLETHVYRLRQKIEADPAVATLLVTEEGGYRLRKG